MSRAVLAAAAGATAAALAVGCGQDQKPERGLPDGPVAIYVSAPTHGPAGRQGRGVLAGVRRAVGAAGGRVRGRPIRVVALPANRPGDLDWDPGTVEANARKAVEDRRAIAYIGEVDSGGSAVSLPLTNRAGLLQVSPADGLTSLTQTPPGKPTAGPARYYPGAKRTFARLVPADLVAATGMLHVAGVARGRRIVIVESSEIAQRELGTVLEVRMLRSGIAPVATKALGDDPAKVPDLVEDLAAERPDAVLLAGDRGPAVGPLLVALRRRLPRTRVVGSPAVADLRVLGAGAATAVTAVLPLSDQDAAARRIAARLGADGAEPLYGYDAAALVLSALRSAGADRLRIVRAARRSVPRIGLTGRFTLGRSGSATRSRLAVVSVRDGRARLVPASP